MSNKMSQATQDRIELAVDRLRDYEGLDLKTAAVKVARELKLSKDMTALVCRAYNVGAVTDHREQSENILDKMAAVKIIPVDEVLEDVFPQNPSTPAQKEAADGVSDCWHQPPKAPVFAKRATKEASAAKETPAEPVKQADERDVLYSVPAQLRKLAEQQATAERELHERIGLMNKKLASSGVSKPEFAAGVLDLFGPLGAPLAGMVGTSPAKTAAVVFSHPVVKTAEPYRSAAEVVAKAKELLAIKEARVKLRINATCYTAYLNEKAAGSTHLLAEQFWDKAAAEFTKFAFEEIKQSSGMWNYIVSSNLARIGADKLTDEGKGTSDGREGQIDKQVRSLSDPAHESELRKIRTSVMLKELINHDDVLRKYPPTQIRDAFNDLSQMAPRSADKPLYTRSLLRKWMPQGGLDTFEASDLASTEKTLAGIAPTINTSHGK